MIKPTIKKKKKKTRNKYELQQKNTTTHLKEPDLRPDHD